MNRFVNKKGFTLVEIVVTALLIGIALVPIFNMLSFGTRHSGSTRKLVMATYLAVESLEIIKEMDFDAVQSSPLKQIEPFTPIFISYFKGKNEYKYDSSEKRDDGKPVLSYGLEFMNFYREIFVEMPNQDCKIVKVYVTWGTSKSDRKKNKIVMYGMIIRENI